jgi:uncharacterized membrane protein
VVRIRSIGHAVFSLTLIALGALELAKGNFTVIWAPVPPAVPGRVALIYLCAVISIGCGAALLFRQTAATGARVLLAYLLLWLLAFRLPGLLHSLAVDVYWAMCSMLVMVAAAWVLWVWFARGKGERIAQTLFGLAMIGFGIAHFQYIQNTTSLVPTWLPAPVMWACVTGAAFVAAGLAIVVGVYGRLAASLAALQMGLFLLLVWIPRMVAGSTTEFQRGETVVSWVLTAAAWVVAESY